MSNTTPEFCNASDDAQRRLCEAFDVVRGIHIARAHLKRATGRTRAVVCVHSRAGRGGGRQGKQEDRNLHHSSITVYNCDGIGGLRAPGRAFIRSGARHGLDEGRSHPPALTRLFTSGCPSIVGSVVFSARSARIAGASAPRGPSLPSPRFLGAWNFPLPPLVYELRA